MPFIPIVCFLVFATTMSSLLRGEPLLNKSELSLIIDNYYKSINEKKYSYSIDYTQKNHKKKSIRKWAEFLILQNDPKKKINAILIKPSPNKELTHFSRISWDFNKAYHWGKNVKLSKHDVSNYIPDKLFSNGEGKIRQGKNSLGLDSYLQALCLNSLHRDVLSIVGDANSSIEHIKKEGDFSDLMVINSTFLNAAIDLNSGMIVNLNYFDKDRISGERKSIPWLSIDIESKEIINESVIIPKNFKVIIRDEEFEEIRMYNYEKHMLKNFESILESEKTFPIGCVVEDLINETTSVVGVSEAVDKGAYQSIEAFLIDQAREADAIK